MNSLQMRFREWRKGPKEKARSEPKPEPVKPRGWLRAPDNHAPFQPADTSQCGAKWVYAPVKRKKTRLRVKPNGEISTITRIAEKAPEKLLRRFATAEGLLAERAR